MMTDAHPADNATACPLCGCPDYAALPNVGGRRYYRCATCSMAFMHPGDRLPLEQEWVYYGLHRNDPADHGYRRFLSRLTEPLAELLPPGAEGLDYGSGPGPALAAMFREQGFIMWEYDPCFAPDPEPLTGTYDFITCTETVEHFHHPRNEFERLARLLRGGGLLAVMTEWLDDDSHRFENWWYVREPTHVSFYSRRTLAWIARTWGWTLHLPRKNVAIWQSQP